MAKAKSKSTLNNILTGIFCVLLLGNLVLMGIFTFGINSKVSDALEIVKPQEGNLTIIKAHRCAACGEMEAVKKKLLSKNLVFDEENVLDSDSKEAQALIKKYEIKKLPALIFESEDEIKATVKTALKSDGVKLDEKHFVIQSESAPYFDIASSESIGLVTMTFINDKKCEDCYDVVGTFKPILKNFGIAFGDEKDVDASDDVGKVLIEKYKITKVPTLIMGAEANEYKSFTSTWAQVGTIEEDGTFILRNLDALQLKYRDL